MWSDCTQYWGTGFDSLGHTLHFDSAVLLSCELTWLGARGAPEVWPQVGCSIHAKTQRALMQNTRIRVPPYSSNSLSWWGQQQLHVLVSQYRSVPHLYGREKRMLFWESITAGIYCYVQQKNINKGSKINQLLKPWFWTHWRQLASYTVIQNQVQQTDAMILNTSTQNQKDKWQQSADRPKQKRILKGESEEGNWFYFYKHFCCGSPFSIKNI